MVGSRFGVSLAWVVVVGVVGICVFAEMSGRVAAVSGRGTFDLVRERLGPRGGLLNLLASVAVTLLTFIAEIGGIALAFELVSGVNYLLIVPFAAFAVWLILWRVKFSAMENVFGLAGLALIVFASRSGSSARTGGSCCSDATHPTVPDRRRAPDVLVLRDRPVRRGDDPVRGVLLLLRRRRGEVDPQGPRRTSG